MGKYKDYIKWRGDLTFTQAPLNEIDSVIFSMLAYIDFEQIFNHLDTAEIALSDAAAVAEQIGYAADKQDMYISEKSALDLLEIIKGSDRFKNVTARNHVNLLDEEIIMQFSATEFQLNENESYIAFRGTDDTITGWKEDFIIAVREMNSGYHAADYLQKYDGVGRTIYVGGHSKGAHLAIYASVKAGKTLQSQIKTIYSNDGPGFDDEFLRSDEYLNIKDKIVSIVPRESVVGMLLKPPAQYQVIDSDKHTLLQHNAIYWRMEGAQFTRSKSLSRSSDKIRRSMASWIDGMPLEEREAFLSDLFKVLDAPKCHTIAEIQNSAIRSIPAITKALNNLAPETKANVATVIKYFLSIDI